MHPEAPSDPATRLVAVTGSTGYLGSSVMKLLGARGLAVSRSRPLSPSLWLRYELQGKPPTLPPEVCGVVHLASDLKGAVRAEMEAAALVALLSKADEVGARFILVSSQSAKQPLTEYGLSKAALEKITLQGGGIVVRPGFIYGGRRRNGLHHMLDTISALPVLPDFGNVARIQPIYVDTLAHALLALLDGPSREQIVELGAPPMSMRSYIEATADALHGRMPRFLLLPATLLRIATSGARRGVLGSLRQMFALQPLSDATNDLGLVHGSLRENLARSINPGRKLLVREGYWMWRNVAGRRSLSHRFIIAYVRAIEGSGRGALDAQTVGAARGRAYRSDFAATFTPARQFNSRLALATKLFELSPEGAEALMRFHETTWMSAVSKLAVLSLRELFVLATLSFRKPPHHP